jgi:hypothetical protein
MISSCIHATSNNRISFFYSWKIFACVYVLHFLYIYLSADRHHGGVHILGIVSSAIKYGIAEVQISLWYNDLISFEYRPTSRIGGSYDSLFFIY